MVTLHPGHLYEVTIDGYAASGEGVCRIDGRAVFVTGGIRGETVRVYIDKVGRTAAWGHVTKALDPSPQRTDPDCPHYGVCGGCQFRHMSYAEELFAKEQRVTDALRRIGGVELPVSVIHGAKNTERYRNKAQLPAAPGGRVGFYKPRTHSVVDVPDCRLQHESAARLRAALLDWMVKKSVPAYDERTKKGVVRHLFLRTNAAGQVLCCVVANARRLEDEGTLVALLRIAAPELTGVVLNINRQDTNVVLGEESRLLWGADYLEDTLCGLTFRLSLPSFYQINREQAEVLYGVAAEFAALTGTETLLDLYCGVGTIGLSMAKRCARVVGVESVPAAVEDAKANAARNGIPNAEFYCADAAGLADVLQAAGATPDVVVLDPPRKGLAPEVVDAVCTLAPRRVVYVSCDPATLARDIKRFAERGYTAQKAAAVDLFPRTAHVESVVLLTDNR